MGEYRNFAHQRRRHGAFFVPILPNVKNTPFPPLISPFISVMMKLMDNIWQVMPEDKGETEHGIENMRYAQSSVAGDR